MPGADAGANAHANANATTFTATAREGARLTASVLGAGALLVPPAVLGAAGAAAPVAWLVHVGIGVAVALAVGLLARARAAALGIADVAGAGLGRPARSGVTAGYYCGFVVGQAAIAVAAARLLLEGVGVADPPPAAVAATGGAILGAATAGAAAGWSIGPRGRVVRLLATLAVAAVGGLVPGVAWAAGLVGGALPGGLATGVFLAFFAGVGWESTAGRGATPGGRRPLYGAVVLAAGTVAVVHIGLTALLSVRSGTAAPHGALATAFALAAAAVLAAYCLTNIPAAAGFARRLGAPSGRRTVVGTGLACLGVLAVETLAGVGPVGLLVGPCLATAAGYLTACVAVLRSGPPHARRPAAVAVVAIVVLALVLATGVATP